MESKKKAEDKMTKECSKITRSLESKIKQNIFSQKVEELTGPVSQELDKALTVIVKNCDQLLMSFKKDEPLYSHVVKIKMTTERALTLNTKLLDLCRNNNLTQTDSTAEKEKIS